MSLNCLNVFPLAIGHRLSRMAVKGFEWKACHLGIDAFDAPLLSKWVQHIGVCGRIPNPSIVGSNPTTCAVSRVAQWKSLSALVLIQPREQREVSVRTKMMNWSCNRGCCGTTIHGRNVRAKEKRDWQTYQQAAEHEQPKHSYGSRW